MKYMILIYNSEASDKAMTQQEVGKQMEAYGAYSQAMVKAGVMVGGERLKPTDTATIVRTKNGRTEVLNGPYADTREQLGGYYMIDVPDLDAAITWAARCPSSSTGTIEVRPIWAM